MKHDALLDLLGLLEKAERGPWYAHIDKLDGSASVRSAANPLWAIVGSRNRTPRIDSVVHAELIAAARNALPELVGVALAAMAWNVHGNEGMNPKHVVEDILNGIGPDGDDVLASALASIRAAASSV